MPPPCRGPPFAAFAANSFFAFASSSCFRLNSLTALYECESENNEPHLPRYFYPSLELSMVLTFHLLLNNLVRIDNIP